MDVSNFDDFTHHSDYSIISSFLLGTVFITSLNYSFQWIRGVFPRIKTWILRKRSPSNDAEKNTSDKASVFTSLDNIRSGENLSLVFTLSLCFLMASIAFFGSLLSFPVNGGATCSFLVAWGGVATQTASVVGIFALLLELRDLGVPDLDHYASLVVLVIEIVLIITNNAVGIGTLKSLDPFNPANEVICYQKHILATALTSSLIALFLEIYVLVRFGLLLARRATLTSQLPAALYDGRIRKALSLLLLEVLTIGPSAAHVNVAADFVPLSIGTLIVLWTFNTYKSGREDKIDDMFNPNDQPLFRSTWFSSSSENSETEMPAMLPPEAMINHPFSAQYERKTSESTISTTTEEGVVHTLERLIPQTARGVVMATVARPTQAKISHVPRNRLSSVAEVDVTSPESVSPTNILMGYWHEEGHKRKGRSGGDNSKRETGASTVRTGEGFSYMVQGLSFPMPPVTSPADTTIRYSSSTLASTEGEEGKKVHLLTFASPFRKEGRQVT